MNFRSPLAGVVASTGSTALKFASTSDVDFAFSLFLYALFVVCSVLVWWLQLRSMGDASNSVGPILLFTAANFISAGIYGWAFHGEEHGVRWILGLSLVVLGICVVQSSGQREKQE